MDKAVMSVRMQQWAGIIQEAATSGLTKTEFCARKGIDRRKFFHWQKRIREYVLENTRSWDSLLRLIARCIRFGKSTLRSCRHFPSFVR